jgi:hypothetical protein
MGDNFPGIPLFTISHLKEYEASPEEFGERPKLPDPDVRKSATQEYPVEKIIAHRRIGRGASSKLEFLVRWEGFGPLHDSWCSPRDLKNAPSVLADYKKTNKL